MSATYTAEQDAVDKALAHVEELPRSNLDREGKSTEKKIDASNRSSFAAYDPAQPTPLGHKGRIGGGISGQPQRPTRASHRIRSLMGWALRLPPPARWWESPLIWDSSGTPNCSRAKACWYMAAVAVSARWCCSWPKRPELASRRQVVPTRRCECAASWVRTSPSTTVPPT